MNWLSDRVNLQVNHSRFGSVLDASASLIWPDSGAVKIG